MDIKQEILKDFINLKRYIKPVSVGQYNDKGVNIGYKQAEDVIEDFLSQAIDRVQLGLLEEVKKEIIKYGNRDTNEYEGGKLYVIENVCEDLDSKITNLRKKL